MKRRSTGTSVLLVLAVMLLTTPKQARAQALPSPVLISGTVYDARSGQPLPNTRVTVWDGENAVLFDVTDAQGRYDLSTGTTRAESPATPSDERPFTIDPLYPNPANSGFVVMTYHVPTEYAGAPTVEVFNALGQRVPSDGARAPGLYFYRLDFGDGRHSNVQRVVQVTSRAPDVRLVSSQTLSGSTQGLTPETGSPVGAQEARHGGGASRGDSTRVELSTQIDGYAGNVRYVGDGPQTVDFYLSPLEVRAIAFGADVTEAQRAHVSSVYTPYGVAPPGSLSVVAPYDAPATLVMANNAAGRPLLAGTVGGGTLGVVGTAGALVDILISPQAAYPGSVEAARAAARAHPLYGDLVAAIGQAAEAGRSFDDDNGVIELLRTVVAGALASTRPDGVVGDSAAEEGGVQRVMSFAPVRIEDAGDTARSFLLTNGPDFDSGHGFVEFAVGTVDANGSVTVTGYLDRRSIDIIAVPPSPAFPQTTRVAAPPNGPTTIWVGQDATAADLNTMEIAVTGIGIVLNALVGPTSEEFSATVFASYIATSVQYRALTADAPVLTILSVTADAFAASAPAIALRIAVRRGMSAVATRTLLALVSVASSTILAIEAFPVLFDHGLYVVARANGQRPSDRLVVCRFESQMVPCTRQVGFDPAFTAMSNGERFPLPVRLIGDDNAVTTMDDLVWTSSNPAVATVLTGHPSMSSTGPLRAELRRGLQSGSTTLRARSVNSGFEAAFQIAVLPFTRVLDAVASATPNVVGAGAEVALSLGVNANSEITSVSVWLESPSGAVLINPALCYWNLEESPPLPFNPGRDFYANNTSCRYVLPANAEGGRWRIKMAVGTVDQVAASEVEAGTLDVVAIGGTYTGAGRYLDASFTFRYVIPQTTGGQFAITGNGTYREDNGYNDTFTISGSGSYQFPNISLLQRYVYDFDGEIANSSVSGTVGNLGSRLTFFFVEPNGNRIPVVLTRQ